MGPKSWLGVLLITGASVACEDPIGTPAALKLLEFRQRDFGSVALNEELVFFFSEDLDRGSITSDSVRIVDIEGRVVAGEHLVRGGTLAFKPDLPCASNLSDGGLRPGVSYRVFLGGFPRPDGIRSQAGELLSACLVLEFRTAEAGGAGPLFLDPFLGPFPLVPYGKRLEIEEGFIVLEHGEALDPSSIPGCRFELSHYPPGASELEAIPIRTRLLRNRRSQALLLLEPVDANGVAQRLAPDRYYLRMPGRELRTLGGRAVEPGWRYLELVIRRARVEVDFTSSRDLSSEAPPDCDGTALWSGTEPGLEIRYPAAAGDGRAGQVVLRSAPEAPDTQAARLSIPAGVEVDLSSFDGPIVLRSQASLEVRGHLLRRGAAARFDPLALELERATSIPDSLRAPLTPWIEKLVDPTQPWAHEPWTVLIAGGDIRVPPGGAIDVQGPLVLIAGGWIRVDGTVVAGGDLWKTSPGGDRTISHAKNRDLPLVLDPPLTNPLRYRFSAGAMTQDIPWVARRNGWRSQLLGLEGAGRIHLLFLQGGPQEGKRLLEDAEELRTGPMRVLVKLELSPGRGEPWDPPRFERLRLEAEPVDLIGEVGD